MNNSLKIGFCDRKSAKIACKMFHYTKTVPPEPTVRFGAWENDKFIGVVIFGRGSNCNAFKCFDLKNTEGCELTRVSLSEHKVEVTKIIKICILLLTKKFPKLKIIISYADRNQNHKGSIYQAGNWVYLGETSKDKKFIYKGKEYHSRSVAIKGIAKMFGKYKKVPKQKDCKIILLKPKYKYCYPLSEDLKKICSKMSKPYPRSA